VFISYGHSVRWKSKVLFDVTTRSAERVMAKHVVTDQGRSKVLETRITDRHLASGEKYSCLYGKIYIIRCDISLIVRYVTIVLRKEIENGPTAMSRSVR
jgi:hypothetical protein